MTTISQLDRCPLVKERFAPILDATRQMTAPQIRNMATVGGKLVSRDGELSPIQKAFVHEGTIQCGSCTPGMVAAASALLASNPNPTVEETKEALAGNLCRCTG